MKCFQWRAIGVGTVSCGLLLWAACETMDMGGDGGNGTNGGSLLSRIVLNLVKLSTQSTTLRGPAVGDGVLAFNADGNAILAWLRAGETQPQEVPAPSGMTHDSTAFQFAGKKLVVRDRLSGSLYVFDTELGQSQAMSSSSINMGGSGGPNLWEADGQHVATVNATVTTADGAGKRIKVVDISNINSFSITPFNVDPVGSPSAIDLDASARRVVVRGGDTFFVYDMDNPSAAPQQFTRSALQGGTGTADLQVRGNTVAFFDDSQNLTLLDVSTGQFSQPSRNPGRANRGLTLVDNRFLYFVMQNADDGGSISQANRALLGSPANLASPLDPAGAFVNGQDATNGRVGFGATGDISPNGRFAFVAGETAVGVDSSERLYLSVDGAAFQAVADAEDSLNVLRAAGVAASDNLVAFLIPTDPNSTSSTVAVGYAELPPP